MIRPHCRPPIWTAWCSVALAFLVAAIPVGAQDFFPPGYDVPLSAPYGEVSIGRPRGPAFRPVVIYFPNSAWPDDAECRMQDAFDALDAAGIAVAQLWMGGDTLDRDARSIERGLRTIRQRARSYRLDLSRVTLLGCGAGGHFAALVGTNPEFMARAGLDFASIVGIAIVDGTGFDLRSVAAQLRDDGSQERERQSYFPRAEAELEPYSFESHLALPNAPSWLLMGAIATDQGPAPAIEFGRRLQSAGAELVIAPLSDADKADDVSSAHFTEERGAHLANYLRSRLRPESINR